MYVHDGSVVMNYEIVGPVRPFQLLSSVHMSLDLPSVRFDHKNLLFINIPVDPIYF